MKKIYKNLIPAAAFLLTLGMTSCTGDLDVEPLDPNMSTEMNVEGLFNKCYANIAMAGNGGANGDCDIDGIDGGTSGYIRQCGIQTNFLQTRLLTFGVTMVLSSHALTPTMSLTRCSTDISPVLPQVLPIATSI